MQKRLALICASVFLLALSDRQVAGGAQDQLLALRRKCLDELETRIEADAEDALDLSLSLDEAADNGELRLVLRRRGGRWLHAYATVPAWRQETFLEKWYFHHYRGGGAVYRDKWKFPLEVASALVDRQVLRCRLVASLRLDQLADERVPPEERWSWWNRYKCVGHRRPRREQFVLDGDIALRAHRLRLVLEGGAMGLKGRGRRPIIVSFRLPPRRWDAPDVRTPTWNGGYHEADVSGLSFGGGRLTGTLRVTLNPDKWIPRDKKPRKLSFAIEASLPGGRLTGRYKATGDMGNYEGAVGGAGGREVEGPYRASGEMGQYVGRFRGFVARPPASVKSILAREPSSPADAYHQLSALLLALEQYPRPLDQALRTTALAQPKDPERFAEQAAAYAACAVEDYQRRAPVVVGCPEPPSPFFGPYVQSSPLEATGEAAARLPADISAEGPQRWQFIPRWRLCGPFPLIDTVEDNLARLPEVLPASGTWLIDQETLEARGAALRSAAPLRWQLVEADLGRVAPPWEKKGFFDRFRGELWFAAAAVHSDADRTLWLAISASDHAKLWVNGHLVWTDSEKDWAYRSRRMALVGVPLRKGPNELLVRCRRDRRLSWFRLHLCTGGSPRGVKAEPARITSKAFGFLRDGTGRYPEAKPPLAWDIDKGINVLWRTEVPPGRAQPVLAGRRLLFTADPHTLVCLDADSGKELWRREANVLELIAPQAVAEWNKAKSPEEKAGVLSAHGEAAGLRVKSLDGLARACPVADGRFIWAHFATGVAACFDLAGNRKWMVRTPLTDASARLATGHLVVEGEPSPVWEGRQPDPPRRGKRQRKAPAYGVIALDPASGKMLWKRKLPGEFRLEACRLLSVVGRSRNLEALLTSAGQVLRVSDGAVLFPRLDLDPPEALGFDRALADGRLFLASQGIKCGMEFWLAEPGRPAFRWLWENHYEISGFGNVGATAVCDGHALYTWSQVQERGPHCPSPLVEVNAFEVVSGVPLARLKPAMKDAVRHQMPPVVAGRHAFFSDAGGGPFGGLQTHGQISVVATGPTPRLLCTNRVPLGTTVPPIFAGGRMFIRSPHAVVCVALRGEEGRRWQATRLAETLFAQLGPKPAGGEPPAPLPSVLGPPGAEIPFSHFKPGEMPARWLVCGPFPKAPLEEVGTSARALTPVPGAPLTIGGVTRRLLHFGPRFVAVSGPTYAEEFNLQGRGVRIPVFERWLDPAAWGGPEAGAAILVTALENGRDRVVAWDVEAKGLAAWLDGLKLSHGHAVRLRPGDHALVVAVWPEFFATEKSQEPLDVGAALKAGALEPLRWPKKWKVVGPLPPDAPPLKPREVAETPGRIKLGDRALSPNELPSHENILDLSPLLDIQPGEKPTPSPGPPRQVRVTGERSVWCFAEIRLPQPGTLVVNTAADWFMAWHVDGKRVYETLTSGNRAPPTHLTAHTFAVKLDAGRHVLAVMVKPGSKGWSLTSLGAFASGPTAGLGARFPAKGAAKVEVRVPRLTPRFRQLLDPAKELARWLRRLGPNRDRLEQVVESLPGSDHSRRARQLLAMLDANSPTERR